MIGFVVISGHGIDPIHHANAHSRVEQLFASKLTEEHKRKFAATRKGSVNQGFFGISETSNLHPDQVEGWVVGPRPKLRFGGILGGHTQSVSVFVQHLLQSFDWA